MSHKVSIWLLSTLLSLVPISGWAQVSLGGVPESFFESSYQTQSVATRGADCRIFHSDVNPTDFIKQSRWEASQGAPLLIGKPLAVDLDLERDGELIKLTSGVQIRRLVLSVEECQAMTLYYDRFAIPSGGKLYIYTPDHKEVLGAYTRESNPSGGLFATEELSGSTMILEYEYPTEGTPAEIVISAIGMIFETPHTPLRATGENAAESCYVNINCSEGDDWQDEKNGLVHILVYSDEGLSYCSGALVQNAKQDFRPYILTAAHCSTHRPTVINEPHSAEEFARYIFYFHYEKEGCSNRDIAKRHVQSMVGAHLCAWLDLEGQSDGELLELLQPIPLHYNVYYNGWSRSLLAPASGVGLHYPMADALKISTYTEAAHTRSWEGAKESAHWNVTYGATEHGAGATAEGSSGSPLFDSDHRIRATLTGGNADCERLNGTNMYGKLAYHWDKFKGDGSDSTKCMAFFLDPDGTGVEAVDGAYQKPLYIGPKTFTADYNGRTVYLSWQAPESDTPYTGYLLWRNGSLIATLSPSDLSYEDNPEPGKAYEYALVTSYGSEPEAHSAEVRAHAYTFSVDEAYNVQTEVTESGVNLSWQTPLMTQIISNSYHHNSNGAVRFETHAAAPSVYVGHAWSPQELRPVAGCYLNRIGLQLVSDKALYTLIVRQGDREYSQEIKTPYSTTTDKMQVVALDVPFLLQADEELYVSYHVSSTTSDGPIPDPLDFPCIAVDNGPEIDGGGNLYAYSWFGFSATNAHYNFVLQAEIATAPLKAPAGTPIETIPTLQPDQVLQAPAPVPSIKGYQIYRNGSMIATVSADDLSYTDATGHASDSYQVKVLLDYAANGVVTPLTPTNIIEASWDPSTQTISLEGAVGVTGVHLYDMTGKAFAIAPVQRGSYAKLYVGDLPSGIYLLTLTQQYAPSVAIKLIIE